MKTIFPCLPVFLFLHLFAACAPTMGVIPATRHTESKDLQIPDRALLELSDAKIVVNFKAFAPGKPEPIFKHQWREEISSRVSFTESSQCLAPTRDLGGPGEWRLDMNVCEDPQTKTWKGHFRAINFHTVRIADGAGGSVPLDVRDLFNVGPGPADSPTKFQFRIHGDRPNRFFYATIDGECLSVAYPDNTGTARESWLNCRVEIVARIR